MEGILAKDLYKIYRVTKGKDLTALNGVSLELKPGEILSIIGESGSGKSTLAKMILGLEKPTKGSITIDEIDTLSIDNRKNLMELRKKIQAVFQDTTGTLNPKLSVYHNVEEALVNLTNLKKHERRDRIFQLMDEVGMDSKILNVPVRQLSGGEQRRLSLLRAMSICPKYLVLDEVFSGLDLIAQEKVINILRNYHKKYNCGCILITHDKTVARRISNKIIEVENGNIVREGIAQ